MGPYNLAMFSDSLAEEAANDAATNRFEQTLHARGK
jgi:hypothetical protein